MGRSFKLTKRTQKKKQYKEEKEEVKVVYDHRQKIKTNQRFIDEFKKNMDTPSSLWDGEESMINYNEEYDPSVFIDRGSCCVTFNKCICIET